MDLAMTEIIRARLSFLAQLKISTRIFAGFAAVLVLVAAMGGAGIYGMWSTHSSFDDYGRETSITTQVLQIENDIGDLDRNARQFVFTSSQDNAKAVAEAKGRLE